MEMKKRAVYALLVLVLIVGLVVVGCETSTSSSFGISSEDYGWTIIRSPITGRYYEVARYGYSCIGSEVTQEEYEDYIQDKEE